MTVMMTISFCVNLVVLAFVVPQLWSGTAGMDAAFGPNTPARRTLTCVYAAIWMTSLIAIIATMTGRVEQAVTLAIGLFSVQIIYKLMTVLAVGMANPVVVANLPIAILHVVTLTLILLRR